MAFTTYRVQVESAADGVVTLAVLDMARATGLPAVTPPGEAGGLVPSKPFALWLLVELLTGLCEGGETDMGMACPLPPDDAKALGGRCPLGFALEGLGGLADTPEFVAAHADRFISSVEVTDRIYCAGRYVIRPTDPGWVEHAVAGTVFNTTAFPP